MLFLMVLLFCQRNIYIYIYIFFWKLLCFYSVLIPWEKQQVIDCHSGLGGEICWFKTSLGCHIAFIGEMQSASLHLGEIYLGTSNYGRNLTEFTVERGGNLQWTCITSKRRSNSPAQVQLKNCDKLLYLGAAWLR